MSENPRAYWETYGVGGDFENQIEAYARNPIDESIGLFLFERMGKRMEQLGNGIYARDNPAISRGAYGIPPLPHDLAAIYLRQCSIALQRLADLEQQRSTQGGEGNAGDMGD